MNREPDRIPIYHITHLDNLPGILSDGGLHSDKIMAQRNPTAIGYTHIKQRRLSEIRVGCCGGRFVGEFVPFYFCPRSPMLYTINRGNTGHAPGCQRTILHLVSTLAAGIGQNRAWAISDGNAGASHVSFSADLAVLAELDWAAIHARQWQGRIHQKSAEFLLADFFAWTNLQRIGCHSNQIALQVLNLLKNQTHFPAVSVEPNWYY